MQVIVNGKARTNWSRRHTIGVSLGSPTPHAEGKVLDADTATQAYLARTRRGFIFLGLIGVALGLAILVPGLAVAAEADRIYVVLTAAGSAGAVLFASRWRYLRASRRWTLSLPARAAALPPPGSLVRVDADGVASGARRAAWDALAPEILEFTEESDDTSSSTTIDRLVASHPEGPIAFDRHWIENGGEIVETAFRRLVLERG